MDLRTFIKFDHKLMCCFMAKMFLLIFGLFFPAIVFCQIQDTLPHNQDNSTIDSTSYFLHLQLKEYTVFPSFRQMTRRQQRRYTALERKVRKVYPLAKLAAFRVAAYNRIYLSFKTERQRKDYVKKAEKELFDEFEAEIRHMTISEGRILIKLIDRETGESSYEIIKEFKGGLNAFFWQAIARIFGQNLKAAYDPVNEDRMIENIVMQIDMGMLN